MVIILFLAFIFGIICVLLGFDEVVESMGNFGKFEEYLIGIITLLIYHIIFESFTSRTIGKYITGTIVVMGDGSKPDSQTILKRTLCRIIPFDFLTFLGSPSRGWHDSISDTFVVKKKEFDERKKLFYDFDEIGKEIED